MLRLLQLQHGHPQPLLHGCLLPEREQHLLVLLLLLLLQRGYPLYDLLLRLRWGSC
jgi:hypothetical protein